MSRVIKFRAWDGKAMINPYSVRNGKAFVIKNCDTSDLVIRGEDGSNYYKNWDVDVATEYPLMQFTGLTDVNGVEIYEGDVVRYDLRSADGKGIDKRWEVGAVKMDHTGVSFGPWMAIYCTDARVIGSIYENPELLEKSSC